MNVRELIKFLEKDGWYRVPSNSGSHLQFKHHYKKGKVTVPNHKGDIKIKTLNSILKQSGLK